MKITNYPFRSSVLVLAALIGVCFTGGWGMAAPVSGFLPNIMPQGYANATASSTFNTASYVDLPAATISVVPLRNDPTTYGDWLFVTWAADMSKATGTSGNCAVYANGAIVAATAQYVYFVSGVVHGSVSWDGVIPNTTVGTQTVKLQCESADTSVLTVSNAQLTVWEVDNYKSINP